MSSDIIQKPMPGMESLIDTSDIDIEDPYQLSWKVGNAIVEQQENVTEAYFKLGALCKGFDDAELWRYQDNPTTQAPYTSMRNYLDNNEDLDRSSCQTAMQSWRLYVETFQIPTEVILKIAPSKFIDLNPIVNGLLKDFVEARDAISKQFEDNRAQYDEDDPDNSLFAPNIEEMAKIELFHQTMTKVEELAVQAENLSRPGIRKLKNGEQDWVSASWKVDVKDPSAVRQFTTELIARFKNGGEVLLNAKQPPKE